MENLGTNMTSEREGKGPVVGIVVIIILLILGGVYLWQSKSPVETPVDETATTTDQMINDLSTQGTSTDETGIEADVNATNLNGLDSGMTEVEGELNTNVQ
ncbi:MAG: hypothetical protein KBC48_02815 [Candidatus Pacebacteria bacterium]|nr:hypothetical protein [Candidatus Paceibacterota bacterium]